MQVALRFLVEENANDGLRERNNSHGKLVFLAPIASENNILQSHIFGNAPRDSRRRCFPLISQGGIDLAVSTHAYSSGLNG
jgi:hypothetical protein